MPDMNHADALIKERNGTHGDWAAQAQLAEVLWQNFLQGVAQANEGQINLTPSQLQAIHMICTKVSRIACGDPNEPDHWEDIAGYATLAAREICRVLVEQASGEKRPS